MKISQAFPSKFLRAADLNDRPTTVQISAVEEEEVGQERETKPVLYFAGKDKGMVLNKTNAITVAKLHGDNTEDWVGQTIILFPAMVSFKSETVEAIRIKAPPRTKASEPKRPEAGPNEPIPF